MGTWGNFGETRGGVGKSDVLEHKSGNISETRRNRGGKVIGTHQRSFERYHPRPLTASSSSRLGIRNPHPKTPVAIISGTDEATNFKFGRNIHMVHPKKPVKNFGEKEAWAYPGTAQILRIPPIIPGTGRATNFKF